MMALMKANWLLAVVLLLLCPWMDSCVGDAFLEVNYELDADEDAELIVGSPALFRCHPLSLPGTYVQWLKDGIILGESYQANLQQNYGIFEQHVLPSSFAMNVSHVESLTLDEAKLTVLLDGSLYIRNVSKHDTGEYSCFVRDVYGKVLRKRFIKYVNDLPECAVLPGIKQYARKHSNARFHCSANFIADVKYRWTKDDIALTLSSSSRKTEILDNGVLQIFSLDSDDSGWYKCYIKTPHGEASCGPVELKVSELEYSQVDLKFLYAPTSMTVPPKQRSAIIECLSEDSAAIHSWAKIGGKICDDGLCSYKFGASIHRNNLILKELHRKDSGFYSCILHRFSRTINATMYLDKLEKPYVKLISKPRPVVLSGKALFNCQMTAGNPTGKIYWIRDGMPLDGNARSGITVFGVGKSSRLTILNVKADDEGYYQCIANNSVGAWSAGSYLHVIKVDFVPPPINVTAIAVSSSTIIVSWIRSSSPDVQSYEIEHESVSSGERIFPANITEYHFHIKKLHPFTTYIIRVTAFTPYGLSEPGIARAKTFEDVPGKPINSDSIKLEIVNTSTILVSWDSLPKHERNGVILSYTVTYYHREEKHKCVLARQDPSDDGIATEFTVLTGLVPDSEYAISVTPETKIGPGLESGLPSIRTYAIANRSCISNGCSAFHCVHGQIRIGGIVRVFWKLHLNTSVTDIYVGLFAMHGDFLQGLSLKAYDTNATFMESEYYDIFIVRMTLNDAHSEMCETYNFTVSIEEYDYKVESHLPINLTGHAVGPYCIRLYWQFDHTLKNHLFYIRYKTFNGVEDYRYKNTSLTCIDVCGLKPWTRYDFEVASVTANEHTFLDARYVKSDGFIRTEKAAPGTVHRLRCFSLKVVNIMCEWEAPLNSNGIIHNYTFSYHVRETNQLIQYIIADTKTSVSCLQSNTVYAFRVSAANNFGNGPSTSVQVEIQSYNSSDRNCSQSSVAFGDILKRNESCYSWIIIMAITVTVVTVVIITGLLWLCLPKYGFCWNHEKEDIHRTDKIYGCVFQQSNGCNSKSEQRPTQMDILVEQNVSLLPNSEFRVNDSITQTKLSTDIIEVT